ncbi:MAG: LysM peptidoglycan-binding domain-containing protein [Cyanobacteria bacterium HKST-UBA02]|nr:LysM peptidoglycan-binding domain-containing protein [Cyanobacteria bacterium HKST-UBA02]
MEFEGLPGRHESLDHNRDHVARAASERLHSESDGLLRQRGSRAEHTAGDTGAGKKQEKPLMPGLEGNDYTIRRGDSISAIAVRMLKLRGEEVSSHSVYEEVGRIIDLNSPKHPWIEKHPERIKPGMKLKVWDSDTGPDPSCKWKDWSQAEPGRTTVAQRCQSVFAGKDTQVIVAPGGRAVFTSGSFGFVAPRGYARALTGANVMAVGGNIIDDGAAIQILHSEAIVRKDPPRPPSLISESEPVRETVVEISGEPSGEPSRESGWLSHEEIAMKIKDGFDVPPV